MAKYFVTYFSDDELMTKVTDGDGIADLFGSSDCSGYHDFKLWKVLEDGSLLRMICCSVKQKHTGGENIITCQPLEAAQTKFCAGCKMHESTNNEGGHWK